MSVVAIATSKPSLRSGLRISITLTGRVWNGLYHRQVELVDVLGAAAAVGAGDRDRLEDGGLGDLGEARELGALQRRAAVLAGLRAAARARSTRGVGAHPGRDA